jgi:predicted nucleic acid-binding protein
VLDTCVIVAAVRSRSGASFVVVDLAISPNKFFQPVLTEALANQYEDVIYRPEHRVPDWTDDDLYALIQSLLVPSHWAVTNFSYRPSLEDAGDELVLEAAINGGADKIVTFNAKDFKPAARFGIEVVTPGDLLKVLRARGFVYGEE